MREKAAFFVLRASLGVVFLLFGAGKFQNDYWARTMATLPIVEKMPWPTVFSVRAMGTAEIAVAVALISGYCLRPAAIIAAGMLLGILVVTGFQETRDIALLGCALFLAMRGPS